MQGAEDTALQKIDLRQAVDIAMTYARQIFPSVETSNALVEEVEETSDGSYWLITLGFDTERVIAPTGDLIAKLTKSPRTEVTRVYKTFKIDTSSRRVVSMKIRPME